MAENELRVLITGDFIPNKRIDNLIREKRLSNIYNDFREHLVGNDLNITNLECPFFNGSNPIPKIGPCLKADPNNIEALTYGKFNLVTLANNHIMDHGVGGLRSTLQLCDEKGIDYVGAHVDSDKVSNIYYYSKNNFTVGIINVAENEFSTVSKEGDSGANPLDPVANSYQIREARAKSDVIILIVHGGHEYYDIPSPAMVKLYRYFIDLGVDIVVGHHPHCYSGFEKYNNGHIFYSLGNFIFDSDKATCRNSSWNTGYAIKFVLKKNQNIGFELIPYIQNDEKPGVYLLTAEQNQRFNENIERINSIISSNKMLRDSWDERVQLRSKAYLKNLLPFRNRYIKALYFRLVPYYSNFLLLVLNVIRCESHREILMDVLRKETGSITHKPKEK